jgi:23S rRNA (guanosine2251-2'-O)-methyltransferase
MAAGDVSLPKFNLSSEGLVLVIGSEGKGLSRLVQENCDTVLSIPIAKEN